MNNVVEIKKSEILSAISCAEDYGYKHFVPDLVEWYGPISAEEIADYANSYLEKDGYGEEDIENVSNALIEAFHLHGSFRSA